MTAMMKKLPDNKLFSSGSKVFRSFSEPESFDNYSEWRRWAEEEDRRSGMAAWREKDKTPLYDYRAIQRRFQRLRDLREEGNDRGLLFALHEGVHGNMAGMGSAQLYNQSWVGTKRLVEEYIDEIVTSLEHIDQVSEESISHAEKHAFFERVDECFGRSALMLSGGGALGSFHLGVVKALFEQGILPNIISGSSVGSLFTGVFGTHDDQELKQLFASGKLMEGVKEETSIVKRLMNPRGDRYDEKQLEALIADMVPDLTFEEAFEKTGRHINIPVAPARLHQTSRLLNSITSPNIYIRSAVMASCAVPGVFEPVQLRAKNFSGGSQDYLPGRKWVDGSMDDDLPAKRLSRLYGVNHFIASQINPLVIPFVSHPESTGVIDTLSRPYKAFAQEWIKATQALGAKVNFPMPRTMRMALNAFYQVTTQKYTADINVILNPRYIEPMRLLSHPTEKQVEKLVIAGERSTWPLISRIDNSTRISRAVERILERY